jgi:hypothetical protein
MHHEPPEETCGALPAEAGLALALGAEAGGLRLVPDDLARTCGEVLADFAGWVD